MKLSIVTLTYNNPKELKKTLSSIPKKEYVESIIINGGDSQETIDYLKNYDGKVINEKDKGIADAFNKGIKFASGDAVMFINSGDILIDSKYIEKAFKILNDSPEIGFIHSNIIFDDKVGGEIFMRPRMKNLGRGMPYLHPTMIMRKNLLENLNGFNIHYKISMDFDLVVRMSKQNIKGFYINEKAAVKMEGKGKSSAEEFKAIKECFRSLKENNLLTIKNLIGLKIRILLYFGRQFMVILGGKKILRSLKRIKYSE